MAMKSVMDLFAGDGEKDKDKEEEGKKPDSNKELEELRSQLSEMRKELNDARAQSYAYLTAQPSTPSQPSQPQDPEVDMSNMPDPTEDPEAYNKELNRRIAKAIRDGVQSHSQAEAQARAEEERRSTQTSALWDQFTESHPDIAKNRDQVEFAAMRVLNRIKARGLDPDRYMFGATGQFFNEIVEEHNKVFPQQKAKDDGEGEGEGEPEPKNKPKSKEDDDEDEGRSAGIFGGQEGGHKPSAGASKGDDKPGDLVADLHTIQRASGFY